VTWDALSAPGETVVGEARAPRGHVLDMDQASRRVTRVGTLAESVPESRCAGKQGRVPQHRG
jgi:hypothetical protein